MSSPHDHHSLWQKDRDHFIHPYTDFSVFQDEGSQIAAACVQCHGERGTSNTPNVPNLAGQHPMYLIVATQEYASGERDNAEKEAMLSGLDNVDIPEATKRGVDAYLIKGSAGFLQLPEAVRWVLFISVQCRPVVMSKMK